MAVMMVGCENIFGLINLRNFHSPEVTLEPELSSLTGYHQLRKFVLISFSVEKKKKYINYFQTVGNNIKKKPFRLHSEKSDFVIDKSKLAQRKIDW